MAVQGRSPVPSLLGVRTCLGSAPRLREDEHDRLTLPTPGRRRPPLIDTTNVSTLHLTTPVPTFWRRTWQLRRRRQNRASTTPSSQPPLQPTKSNLTLTRLGSCTPRNRAVVGPAYFPVFQPVRHRQRLYSSGAPVTLDPSLNGRQHSA